MTQTDVPVLLIGFNRPESMRSVINAVRTAAPRSVFFAVDGPRSGSTSDGEKVQATRDLVQEIDWPCEIHTLFREVNLGCAEGVSGAITWFFDHVSEGIILEDDVLPDPSFFPFCTELLDRYRMDDRVWCISGSNRIPVEEISSTQSYRFSTVPQVWGWATWRDRWNEYSLDIKGWRRRGLSNNRLLQTVGFSPSAFAFWSANFDLMSKMAVDTWDTQFVNAAMRNRSWAVIPNVNLVENRGWGADATHTKAVPPCIQTLGEMAFPLIHPEVAVDKHADRFMNRKVYQATPVGLLKQFKRYRASR